MSRFHLHHGRLVVFTHLLDLTTKNGWQLLKGALEYWILNGQMQQFLYNVYLTVSPFFIPTQLRLLNILNGLLATVDFMIFSFALLISYESLPTITCRTKTLADGWRCEFELHQTWIRRGIRIGKYLCQRKSIRQNSSFPIKWLDLAYTYARV